MTRKSGLLLLCVLVLFILGLSMVFNTTSAEVLDRALAKSTHHALIRQLLYAILAGILAAGVWFLGFDQILRLSGFFLVFVTFLLILVFIPGIGQCLNGAHRWLGIGSYSFQPSELAKYLIPLYYISYVTSAKTTLVLKDFLKLLLKLAVPMGLILIEPDNGTVAIILSSLLVLFLLTKIRWVYWGLPLLVILITGGAVASQMPHVHNRIQIYLHPELDLQGKGHQPHQAKIAAGSGGVFGKGLGESLQKLNYLPEARSDYIAAIFAEEFGFVGICLLVVLYTFIGYLGFSIASQTDHLPAFYTVAIFTFLICFQAFLNLGVVSGLLPSKGTNLPFFSHGSSSLLANLIVICIILNIANKKNSYVIT
ncbi:MAG TPA: putative peptidoglycan glycosyltransferase FtsW [Rhabdochlamydiaceae bacterium]|nr:putative peptidoglycan glycosyltransferase FtsW [Rhabdochlamydiaceae bacterium]